MRPLPEALKRYGAEKAAAECGVGVPTLQDIAKELVKPGRDPRDELPVPILRTDVLELKDLKPGMVLSGTVRNVIDFGVFVDIGVHQDGLVHISASVTAISSTRPRCSPSAMWSRSSSSRLTRSASVSPSPSATSPKSSADNAGADDPVRPLAPQQKTAPSKEGPRFVRA